MRYVLDTNVVSEPIKARPHPSVVERLRDHSSDSAIAAPVWHELRYGAARLPPSRRRETIERYLEEVVRVAYPILPYDEACAEWHARERARLEKAGKPAAWVDGAIAAIAAVAGAVLVTSKVGDYRAFRGIRVVDWSRS